MTSGPAEGGVAPKAREQRLMRDVVYELMVERIISGDLSPGDRVTERDLAKRFGISTTPIKEALRRLESEGFVRTLPRRGVVVSENALASLGEVVVVRAALEGLAARLAAERVARGELSPEDHKRLTRSIEPLAVLAPETPETTETETHAAFHDLVHDLAENHLLLRFGGMLLGVEAPPRRRALSDPDEAQLGREEHRAIGKAIMAGDPELAERQMRAHALRSASRTIGRNHEQDPS